MGRILRKRPEDRTVIPMVYDVVDSHSSLIRQFSRSRLPFYKKCHYIIENWIWNEREEIWSLRKTRATRGDSSKHISDDHDGDGDGDGDGEDDEYETTTSEKPVRFMIKIPGAEIIARQKN